MLVEVQLVVLAPLGDGHLPPEPRPLRHPAIAQALGVEDPPTVAGVEREVTHGQKDRCIRGAGVDVLTRPMAGWSMATGDLRGDHVWVHEAYEPPCPSVG